MLRGADIFLLDIEHIPFFLDDSELYQAHSQYILLVPAMVDMCQIDNCSTLVDQQNSGTVLQMRGFILALI